MSKSFYLSILPIVIIATLFGCSNKSATEQTQVRPVRALKISSGASNNIYTLAGNVKASKESTLSFRVSGIVTEIPVTLGSQVSKGQLLAKMDNTDYHVSYSSALAQEKNAEASMQSTRAQMSRAESDYIRNKANYQRTERLYETNSVPLSEFEQARASFLASKASFTSSRLQLESSKAQLTSTRQQTQSAKNQLSYTQLKAPFSGIVSQILFEENEQVPAGTGIIVLSSEGNPEIEIGAPASIISVINKGDATRVSFFNLGEQTFSGHISEVGFSSGTSSVYPVIVQLDENNPNIRPGMSADVQLTLAKPTQTNNYLVPLSAVGKDSKGNFVFLLTPHQSQNSSQQKTFMVKRQAVTVDAINANGFEVSQGIKVGQYIATAGLAQLQVGDIVSLYNDNNIAL